MRIKDIINFLKQPKIFVFAIIWMMMLVVLGTLAQKDMGLYTAQKPGFGLYPCPEGVLLSLSF